MKFKSRKDIIFQLLVFGFSAVSVLIISFKVYQSGYENSQSFWSDAVLLLLSAFLLWLYFGTSYEINATEVSYKSGPLRGTIKISDITDITKGKTQWSGLKPATARRGLVIRYNQYDEIYISPETNDTFVNKLLELNPDIRITTGFGPKFKM
jgi:hypothetical protein